MISKTDKTLAGRTKGRILQVSLEGLDLSDAQVAKLEDTMRTAVLAELARIELPRDISLEPIGKGTIRDGWLINGIIINDLGRLIGRTPRV